jgi:hypothetical protein
MFFDDIVYYMQEFRRVLKSTGLAWVTFFIANNDILASARQTKLTPFDLCFEHPYGEGCYVNDIAHPGGAVAFSETRIMEMVSSAQLELATPPIFGSWSGFFPQPPFDPGQDAVVLRRKS